MTLTLHLETWFQVSLLFTQRHSVGVVWARLGQRERKYALDILFQTWHFQWIYHSWLTLFFKTVHTIRSPFPKYIFDRKPIPGIYVENCINIEAIFSREKYYITFSWRLLWGNLKVRNILKHQFYLITS